MTIYLVDVEHAIEGRMDAPCTIHAVVLRWGRRVKIQISVAEWLRQEQP